MLDKNGTRIKAGDIVRIAGAYFKTDNGLYFVEEDGTNPGYLADDTEVTLKKVCKNGKISTAKYALAFFPLKAFCSDRAKNAAAREWNAEHATIEIVNGIDRSQVIEYFEEKAKTQREAHRQYIMRGWCESVVKQADDTATWYETVTERLRMEERHETISEPEPADDYIDPCKYTVKINGENIPFGFDGTTIALFGGSYFITMPHTITLEEARQDIEKNYALYHEENMFFQMSAD